VLAGVAGAASRAGNDSAGTASGTVGCGDANKASSMVEYSLVASATRQLGGDCSLSIIKPPKEKAIAALVRAVVREMLARLIDLSGSV